MANDPFAEMRGVSATVTTFQKAVSVTGTAVQISATSVPLKNGAIVQANQENSGPITIGKANVTNVADGTGNGKTLQPGQSWSFSVNDLNLLYVNGAAGDWCDGSAD